MGIVGWFRFLMNFCEIFKGFIWFGQGCGDLAVFWGFSVIYKVILIGCGLKVRGF